MIGITFNTHMTDHFKHFEPFKVETYPTGGSEGHSSHSAKQGDNQDVFSQETPERELTLPKSARVDDI